VVHRKLVHIYGGRDRYIWKKINQSYYVYIDWQGNYYAGSVINAYIFLPNILGHAHILVVEVHLFLRNNSFPSIVQIVIYMPFQIPFANSLLF
jgi:hypothetical protein